MAELLVEFTEQVSSRSGDLYHAAVFGRVADDGLWQGWLEFRRGDDTIKTGVETIQPNRNDLVYWAEGLSMIYLQGALERALAPSPSGAPREKRVLVDSGPRKMRPRDERASR